MPPSSPLLDIVRASAEQISRRGREKDEKVVKVFIAVVKYFQYRTWEQHNASAKTEKHLEIISVYGFGNVARMKTHLVLIDTRYFSFRSLLLGERGDGGEEARASACKEDAGILGHVISGVVQVVCS